MPRRPSDPSGRALLYNIRLAPAVIARLLALAAKWGCEPRQAAQRAILETLDREVPVVCRACRGTGRVVTGAPGEYADDEVDCDACNGSGIGRAG